MLPPVNYEMTIEVHPHFLHARARGDRTAENASRFLREAYEACVHAGVASLLLEMRFTGATLGTPKIFEVVAARSGEGMRLKKVAYVDVTPGAPGKPSFAETVARNRGVNVRLFPDIAAAARWLRQEDES